MRRSWLFRIVLVVLPVVAIVAGGEIMMRLVAPQDLSGSWRVPGPGGLVLNKAGGTARHRMGGRQVSYRFNRLHQRGRSPGRHGARILVLGDSFTFGWLVAEHDGFVGRLQARSNRVFGRDGFRFLNAGSGGWGSAQALAYLEHFGPLIRPRAVLMFVNFDDLARSRRNPLYRLTSGQGLALERQELVAPGSNLRKWVHILVPGYDWLLEHSHLVQALRRAVVVRVDPDPANPPAAAAAQPSPQVTIALRPDNGSRLARALFRRMRLWSERNRAALMIVTTGWPLRTYDWAARAAAAENIPFLDLSPALADKFGNHFTDYVIPIDGHPNEAGHAEIADAAWPWLEPKLAALRRFGKRSH
ncbi:MAG: SGNH/GDSL hydrolase family protein [Alphaproteobacteria bacterium]